MRLSEILPQLAAKFPAEDHDERQLPGGGRWWYVKWQKIRDRLDEVCPDNWSVSYGTPSYLGDLCYVTCKLTICGVTREGVGSAQITLLSSSGKDMSRGNPIERSVADAFKNAAEQFRIAAYLDEQADEKTKNEFRLWMQRGGNGKPLADYHKQQREARPVAAAPTAQPQPPKKPIAPKPTAAPSAPPVQTELPTRTNGDNLARLRNVTTLLGLSQEQGDPLIQQAIAALYDGRKTKELIEPEVRAVRDRVMVLYARSFFDARQVPDSTLMGWFLGTSLGGESDEELVRLWLGEISERRKKYKSVIG